MFVGNEHPTNINGPETSTHVNEAPQWAGNGCEEPYSKVHYISRAAQLFFSGNPGFSLTKSAVLLRKMPIAAYNGTLLIAAYIVDFRVRWFVGPFWFLSFILVRL